MLNRKAVAGLATFSLVLLLFFIMFSLSYAYYSASKTQIVEKNKELELQNTLYSLRSEILQLVLTPNSSISYTEEFGDESTVVYFENSKLLGEIDGVERIVKKNISLFGVDFCSNYNVSTSFPSIYSFNGSCVTVSTS